MEKIERLASYRYSDPARWATERLEAELEGLRATKAAAESNLAHAHNAVTVYADQVASVGARAAEVERVLRDRKN